MPGRDRKAPPGLLSHAVAKHAPEIAEAVRDLALKQLASTDAKPLVRVTAKTLGLPAPSPPPQPDIDKMTEEWQAFRRRQWDEHDLIRQFIETHDALYRAKE
jgi:hypothetical protein